MHFNICGQSNLRQERKLKEVISLMRQQTIWSLHHRLYFCASSPVWLTGGVHLKNCSNLFWPTQTVSDSRYRELCWAQQNTVSWETLQWFHERRKRGWREGSDLQPWECDWVWGILDWSSISASYCTQGSNPQPTVECVYVCSVCV